MDSTKGKSTRVEYNHAGESVQFNTTLPRKEREKDVIDALRESCKLVLIAQSGLKEFMMSFEYTGLNGKTVIEYIKVKEAK